MGIQRKPTSKISYGAEQYAQLLGDDLEFKKRMKEDQFKQEQISLKNKILEQRLATGDKSDLPEVKDYFSNLVQEFLLGFIDKKL